MKQRPSIRIGFVFDQDIDEGRGSAHPGAYEHIRLTLGKPAVDYAVVLYFDQPQVKPAADLFGQRVFQEVPGVVHLGEHGTKKLVMYFMQLFHTLSNRHIGTAASKSGKNCPSIGSMLMVSGYVPAWYMFCKYVPQYIEMVHVLDIGPIRR